EARALVDDGDSPAISPRGDVVAFVKEGQIWTSPLDGSSPPKRLFSCRGTMGSPVWSPDGRRLAFIANRTDHAFVGMYRGSSMPIQWIDPSTTRDGSPRWSQDGRELAFVRRPGLGVAPEPVKKIPQAAWSIWIADTSTGRARELWKSPTTANGAV